MRMITSMDLLWLLLIALYPGTECAFCGPGEAPIRLDIDTYNIATLNCQKPTCVHATTVQIDECRSSFFESSCQDQLEWVGGIDTFQSREQPLALSCCHSPLLRFSNHLGTTRIIAGDSYRGGDVTDDSGRIIGFDVVNDVEKITNNSSSPHFMVSVSRIFCAGQKPSLNNAVDLTATEVKNFGDLLQYHQRITDSARLKPKQSSQYRGKNFPSQKVKSKQPPNRRPNPRPEPRPRPQQPRPRPEPPRRPPPPSYSPSYCCGHTCFHANVSVQLDDGSTKTMQSLKVGDQVLAVDDVTGSVVYSPVTHFLHHFPDLETQFIKLITRDENVTLTPTHYIYAVECAAEFIDPFMPRKSLMIYARDVRPGKDCLYHMVGNEPQMIEVTGAELVTGTGAYGPMTRAGNVVTNGLLSSCHAITKDSTVVNGLFSLFDTIRQFISSRSNNNNLPIVIEHLIDYIDILFPKAIFS